ncbi:haloalkane dehalogenase [Mycobacterium sp. 2YAF39]|uniref:haloalkane dehalogenase n=1 Tax=Mycobacterium sp. 2YAF39 TaxID=3233033 RepID=UPI003F9833F7
MDILRTPDDRFDNLPDYPYPPTYIDVETRRLPSVRMHYVDAGPADGPVALLLHGQPTWSFMYRKVIRVLVESGIRVIAPDNIGFGRSDKLAEPTAYTFRRHVDWVQGLIDGLDLRDVTLVVEDWAGPIGLSVLAREPNRFAGVVATNTILYTCDPGLAGRLTWAHHSVDGERMVLQDALLDYVTFYQRAPDIDPSLFVDAEAGPLDANVRAAYDAPFPDRGYKAGLRQMTALIPLTPNDPGAAIGRDTMAVLGQWERPFLTAYSDNDAATRGWEKVFQDHVPGARTQEHTIIFGAGHFVAEDKGEELGAIIAQFISSTN